MKAIDDADEYLRVEFLSYQITEADRRLNVARRKLRNCYLHKQKLIKIKDDLLD